MDWFTPVSELPSSVVIEEVHDLPPGTSVMNAAADSLVGSALLGQLATHADNDAIRRMRTPVPIAAVGHFVKQLPKQQRNSKPKKAKQPATGVATAAAKKAKTTASSKTPKRCEPKDAKSLHHFQSRRFQAANRRAVNMGYSDEDRMAFRNVAYSDATIEWNKFYNLA